MERVAFDFDDTLSRTDVQRFADKLVKSDFEVWIVTSRLSDKAVMRRQQVDSTDWNRDLFAVADSLNISHHHIVFCSFQPKYEFFWDNKDFLFHLDDDIDEVNGINGMSDVDAVHFVPTIRMEAIDKCKELIK